VSRYLELREELEKLADNWDGGVATGIDHMVGCRDFGCKLCVVIACASDLRGVMEKVEVS
jgi:hypothetical protein